MRTFRIFMLSLLAVFVCGISCDAKKKVANTVEVAVFHGVKQCETCKAIKKNSQEVVEQYFKKTGKGNKVVYKVIDFSQEANKAIAEKYQIAWTSLLLIKKDTQGKETVNNLSQFAIKNARTNTEEFRKQLVVEIKKMLK
jgi:hypothetical protein